MFYNIPSNKDDGLYIFPGTKGVTSNNEHQSWTVPSSASYISMTVIGPGGRGGLGRAVASVTTKGGGGGGGSGGITSAVFRTKHLPSVLFFNFATSITTISVEPDNSANTYFSRILYALGGGVGGDSTGATTGTGGTAASAAWSIFGQFDPPWKHFALTYNAFGGSAGGGAAGSDPSFMPAGSYILHGGAAGGATTATPVYGSGGSTTPSAALVTHFPTVSGGAGNSTGTGGNGGDGVWFWKPHLLGIGGGGGGAGNVSPGKGGDGAFGCGGGGGGSCWTADPLAYGLGGPGLIIIKCF